MGAQAMEATLEEEERQAAMLAARAKARAEEEAAQARAAAKLAAERAAQRAVIAHRVADRDGQYTAARAYHSAQRLAGRKAAAQEPLAVLGRRGKGAAVQYHCRHKGKVFWLSREELAVAADEESGVQRIEHEMAAAESAYQEVARELGAADAKVDHLEQRCAEQERLQAERGPAGDVPTPTRRGFEQDLDRALTEAHAVGGRARECKAVLEEVQGRLEAAEGVSAELLLRWGREALDIAATAKPSASRPRAQASS